MLTLQIEAKGITDSSGSCLVPATFASIHVSFPPHSVAAFRRRRLHRDGGWDRHDHCVVVHE